jgi:hypothetical protein
VYTNDTEENIQWLEVEVFEAVQNVATWTPSPVTKQQFQERMTVDPLQL